MSLTTFIATRYDDIMAMSKKITKGSPEWEDLGHYCIQQFMEKENALEIAERGEGMAFLSGIMHRSFHSSTSPYHTLYRQKGRVHGMREGFQVEVEDQAYDFETDLVITQIKKIIENMKGQGIEIWYRAILFEMYLEESNYSEISRKTNIPRTSISQAVNEAKEYIKKELIKSGITWN